MNGAGREMVVLIHGLAASRLVLMPIERHLRRHGFRALNWSYLSLFGDIRLVRDSFAAQLDRLDRDDSIDRFHVVAHSMGSIVTRAVLCQSRFDRLGRVVMLAPPHRGSRVAARLAGVLGWCFKPLAQLSDAPGSLVATLPRPDYRDIGIIAASRDRVVPVESTRLSPQIEHVVVSGGHTTMLFRREVRELVERFLRHGTFAATRPPHAD